MEHPNIIETHKLTNEKQEPFLVERYLHALSDAQWRNVGAAESANLLHDIASALSFVHDRGRVHGDVKPDNIGCEGTRYLLLDFGICRPPDQFTEADPTGSLRTRAPELLLGSGPHSEASDVWALGATVFHGIVGRFPLYDPEEPTPKIGDDPEARSAHERELKRRAASEWPTRVAEAIEQVEPPRLRKLLRRALSRVPQDRPQARELAADCRSQLAALVRAPEAPGWLGHRDRIAQLHDFLPRSEVLRRLPPRRQDELRDELNQLRTFPDLPIEEVRRVDDLLLRLADDQA
jgi:serine/threonine protein kinase